MCKLDRLKEPAVKHKEPRLVFCDDLDRWDGGGVGWKRGGREVLEGWDIFIHITESFLCTAETNTSL